MTGLTDWTALSCLDPDEALASFRQMAVEAPDAEAATIVWIVNSTVEGYGLLDDVSLFRKVRERMDQELVAPVVGVEVVTAALKLAREAVDNLTLALAAREAREADEMLARERLAELASKRDTLTAQRNDLRRQLQESQGELLSGGLP